MIFKHPCIIPACIASIALASPVAALTVFDPSNYAQNVMSASRALEQINNQIKALQNQAQMLLNQTQNLQRLDYSSLTQLQDNFSKTRELLNKAQNISLNVEAIDEQFRTLYGEQNSSATDKKLIEDARTSWRNSVAGIEDSMRMQAQVASNMQSSTQEMERLIDNSQASQGALQALQAGNQMLGVLGQQLSDLIAISIAANRSQNLESAERAAAAERGRELRRRFLTPGPGYSAEQ